jgi:broad specificity phosphatase PhoE
MTTIQIFRHDARMDTDEAEKANVDRVYDTPLSTAGVAHAELAAGRPGDIIVSSPLLRCVQTALPTLQGRPLVLDSRFMEVFHPKVIHSIEEFKLRTDDELPTAFYIRTAHGIPKEETRGIGGSADIRYRAAIQDYADRALRAGIKHVTIFTHGDCIGSFAAMLRKDLYSTEFGCSITATYNGSWEFVTSNDVGLM